MVMQITWDSSKWRDIKSMVRVGCGVSKHGVVESGESM